MKQLILLYSLILVLASTSLQAQEDFRKNPPKGGPAPKIELKDAKTFNLDNGLKVIVVENNRLPVVNFQLFIDVPALVEGDKAGAASLAGQLLRAGTTKKTKAEIDEAIDYIGASLNVGSSGMFGSTLTKNTDALLGMMQEILLMPSFPQEEFDKLKQQTVSGLAFSKDNPDAIAARVNNVVRYGAGHPYSEFETEESVANIELADTKAYYETYFKPNNAYLVIVGDITEAKAKSLSKKYFGAWEKGTVKRAQFTSPTAPSSREVKFVNKPGAVQSVLNITHPDAIKVTVLRTILGGYFRSRLNNNIREDKAYSYGVGATISPDRLVGYFNAGGSVRNEVTDSAIVEFLKEIELLTKEAPNAEELDLVKNVITGNFAQGMERPQSTAQYALNIARYKLPKDYYQNYLKRMDAITPADILATAKKYLKPNNAYIVVVGNQDEVADKLGRFAGDGEVDLLDSNGQPVKAAESAGDVSAEQVIAQYLKAIGGEAKLKALKDYKMTMEASVQGQSLSFNYVKKAPGKMSLEVLMMGNVMQSTKFDGEKGAVVMMGQKQAVEGEAALGMKAEAMLFPELDYGKGYYQMELSGVEEVEGKAAYVLQLTDQGGNKKTEYYSKESGLKLRTIATVAAQGQTITTTQDFSEYTAVEGILFPYTIKTSGAMPFPLEMKVTSLKVNIGVEDSVFEIK
jgi:predicted Zn-dependent peptidase